MSELYPSSVAIIGSFRQHYNQVLSAWNVFSAAGLEITSPKGASELEPGIEFVRFESDDPELTDTQVQGLALNRILGADFTYAVMPEGYIGRTACYEIGRVLQADRPLYFSEKPKDLPLKVPESRIASAAELVERFVDDMPYPLSWDLEAPDATLEDRLKNGSYCDQPPLNH
jgi:hypothetical protein